MFKEIKIYLRESIFFRLYFIAFSIINFIYLYFRVIKNQYIDFHGLSGKIEAFHYEYLSNITSNTSILESLLTFLLLIYLIKVAIKKDKIDIKQFFLINYLVLAAHWLISAVISLFFSSVSILYMTLHIYALAGFLAVIFIFFLVRTLYNRTVKIRAS